MTASVCPALTAADADRQDMDAAYCAQLAALADRCEQLGLAEQARITRAWFPQRASDRQYLFVVREMNPTQPDGQSEAVVGKWHEKLMQLRRERGIVLWQYAESCLKAGRAQDAYRTLHELLREDPEHANSRRILGFRRQGSRWVGPTDAPRSQLARSPHPLFGWPRRSYQQIESPHFRLTTSHSLPAGVALATQLEDVHSVWRQLFFPFWNTPQTLQDQFAGAAVPLEQDRKHEVVWFRNRDEYIAQLSKAEPQIGVSLGYYHKGKRTAFYYAGDESLRSTWLHEATHQLFHECGQSVADPGEQANMWIIEGIAMYMESMAKYSGYYTVGGFDADRLQSARARRLSGDFHMPLSELVGLGREDLQKHADLRRLYSQAAGLTHFLMDDQGGRFREPLADYLMRIYQGRDRPESLAEVTHRSSQELDALYPDFLAVRDADLRYLQRAHPLRNLALGRTSVTDVGLKQLASVELGQLEWLDLSHTKTTDAGLEPLRKATGLRQLNLESTSISDSALAIVGGCQQLVELDLSGTAITDKGLPSLEPLRRLKILWLTGTAISDASVALLEHFRDLERLDIEKTQVTQEARQRLHTRLPRLRKPVSP